MPESETHQSESLLPFKQTEDSELALHTQGGKESFVYKLDVKDKNDKDRKIALKENKKVELASIEEMVKLKSFYEFLKNQIR